MEQKWKPTPEIWGITQNNVFLASFKCTFIIHSLPLERKKKNACSLLIKGTKLDCVPEIYRTPNALFTTGCSFQCVFFQDRARIVNSSSKLTWYGSFGRKHSIIYESIIKIRKSFLKRWKTAIPLKGLILNLALQNSTQNKFNSANLLPFPKF